MKNLSDRVAWEMIAEMGWGIAPDYKTISRNAFEKWGNLRMGRLKDFVRDRVRDLGEAVDTWEEDHWSLELEVGSDDSFSDLRYHVVGLGEAAFKEYLNDPTRLAERYRRGEYKESFAYCFLEPEPERTAEEKAETLSRLLADIQRLDLEMTVLANKLDSARSTLGQLVRYANRVAEDCKNNA